MGRRANIIKILREMGYTVATDGPIYSVSLTLKDGRSYIFFVLDSQLDNEPGIVETIVAEMNRLIVNDLKRRS